MNVKPAFQFAQNVISESHVFYQSTFCYGLVNLKPILPGHILVVSKRMVPRLKDLRPEEASDMMISAQKIGKVIEKRYQGTSLTVTIQDGAEAGQTVPHVHVHVIPRRRGDYDRPDDIYDDLNAVNINRVDNEARPPRSFEEMKEEADQLRPLFSVDHSD